VGGAEQARLPARGGAARAAFTLNELPDAARERLLERLLAARGVATLVVEPIATRVSPWWPLWARRVAAAGGRHDEWRFRVALPELVARLDRAAGLDHRTLTARTRWLPATRAALRGPESRPPSTA
jgi:hypothetical protein